MALPDLGCRFLSHWEFRGNSWEMIQHDARSLNAFGFHTQRFAGVPARGRGCKWKKPSVIRFLITRSSGRPDASACADFRVFGESTHLLMVPSPRKRGRRREEGVSSFECGMRNEESRVPTFNFPNLQSSNTSPSPEGFSPFPKFPFTIFNPRNGQPAKKKGFSIRI